MFPQLKGAVLYVLLVEVCTLVFGEEEIIIEAACFDIQ